VHASASNERAVIMGTILRCLPKNHYVPNEIRGYGELYEQVSVNRKLRRIRRAYGDDVQVFLAPSTRSQDGITHEQLARTIATISPEAGDVLTRGYVDNPPWRSKPRQAFRKVRLAWVAKKVFAVLAALERENSNAHMIYAVTMPLSGKSKAKSEMPSLHNREAP